MNILYYYEKYAFIKYLYQEKIKKGYILSFYLLTYDLHTLCITSIVYCASWRVS